ncbi:MAG: class I SAM-dependent methyltransferase, partial [Giesbergeria sp.]
MFRLPWPLPALLAWGMAWCLFVLLARVLAPAWALLLACALPVALSPLAGSWWRRALLAAG